MLHTSALTRLTARLVVLTIVVAFISAAVGISTNASAAPLASTRLSIGLGNAGSFSVLGKAGVTNTGNSVISGNVGADNPGSITGMGTATIGGSILTAPAVNGAEADAQAAFLALQSMGPGTSIGVDPTGPLHPGVYSVGALNLTGELTLDGKGSYVFLMASSLTSSGSINFINGASPCDVFWQVTSNAALVGGSFAGTIIAGTSVTFGNGVALDGRALALTGNVTLINNSISGPTCSGGSGGGAAHASVVYACATDGRLAVTVGVSAGTVVHGLGADITSSTDTGNDKIVRYLSPGHYEWTATPPAGKYLLDADHGVINVPSCAAGAAGATAKPVVALPNTGGAPLQSEDTTGAIALSVLALGALMLVVGVQARRRHANLD